MRYASCHPDRKHYGRGLCKTCYGREAKRAWNARNRDRYRSISRKYQAKFFGYPEPSRPIPAQCECCGKAPGKHGLNLDHEHLTNEFRGWLCSACNRGIGMLGDGLAGVRLALAYLERSGH